MFRSCEGIMLTLRNAFGQDGACFGTAGAGPGVEGFALGHVPPDMIVQWLSKSPAVRNG